MPRIMERLPARVRGGVPLFRLVHTAIALTAYLYALLGSARIQGTGTVLLWTAVMGAFLAWPSVVLSIESAPARSTTGQRCPPRQAVLAGRGAGRWDIHRRVIR